MPLKRGCHKPQLFQTLSERGRCATGCEAGHQTSMMRRYPYVKKRSRRDLIAQSCAYLLWAFETSASSRLWYHQVRRSDTYFKEWQRDWMTKRQDRQRRERREVREPLRPTPLISIFHNYAVLGSGSCPFVV
jgi:hypothetical protein